MQFATVANMAVSFDDYNSIVGQNIYFGTNAWSLHQFSLISSLTHITGYISHRQKRSHFTHNHLLYHAYLVLQSDVADPACFNPVQRATDLYKTWPSRKLQISKNHKVSLQKVFENFQILQTATKDPHQNPRSPILPYHTSGPSGYNSSIAPTLSPR